MGERITILEKEMDILWGKGQYAKEGNVIKVHRNNDVYAIGGFHRWLQKGTDDWKALQTGEELLKGKKFSLFEKILFAFYCIERKIFGDYLI